MDSKNPYQADLDLVQEVLHRTAGSIRRLTGRLECVPRILQRRNARFGGLLDAHDLADLEQDVFIIVWRRLDSYEGRGPIEGWVYRLCCFELMNAIRRKQRRLVFVEDVDGLDPNQALQAARQDPWLAEDVHRALETVGGVAAEVIRLKHFECLTFDEIATVLDLSSNSAKTGYYRGLNKLRDYYEGKRREDS